MAENGKKSGKLRTIIIVIVALILAVGLSAAGTIWFLGNSGSQAASEGNGDQAEVHTPASYYKLDDPLTVSVSADQQRYLQVDLAFVMREHDVSAALKRHLPTIRSRLRGLLQSKSFAQLQSREGKEKLLEAMRDAVNSALEAEGEQAIERVLFTNFVMQ